MNPTTRDEKIYLILKTVENNEGIGPTQLHIKTKIPKKTLYKYLEEMITDQVISKKKLGKKSNSRVSYVVNFSDHTKEAIKNNLAQITKYHKYYTNTKYRKSNTFPHYLQELATEYYQNMMSFLFDNVASYKYGVKRIEEQLDIDKKRLDKQFKGKSKARLWNACQEVQSYLWFNAGDSIHHASERYDYRTRDEIQIDCINHHPLGMGTQHKEQKKLFGIPLAVPIGMGAYQKDFRVHQIKDEKTKKLFIELADEYDKLSQRLSTIKIRLSWITGGGPFEPKNADSWDDI